MINIPGCFDKIIIHIVFKEVEDAMNSENVSERTELKRVLKLPTLVCQGLAYLCPACVLMYYGIINVLTNGHFPLTLIVAGIAMTLTALSYAKMCRKYPVAGSVYSYVSHSIGPKMGFLSGWSLMLDYFLLPMTCYLGCGLYLNTMIPAVPVWAWIILAVIFVAVCNCVGVGVASIVNNINVIAPILALIVTIIFIIKFVMGGGGAGTLLYPEAIYNPEMFNFSSIMTAAGIMAIVFVGFDSVTTYSEETINPEKNMPRAVILICVGAAIEFFIVAYFMNCGWPYEPGAIQDPDTAITEFNVHIGIGWMNTIFVLINTLASIGCCIAGQGATSRILLGMGRDGFLPKKFFGYVHPKFKTPTKNILLTAVARNLVIPIIAAMVCVYLWLSLPMAGKIVGFSWIAIGLIVLAIKTKGFRQLPPELNL